MSQVPGAASPENSLSLDDESSWCTPRKTCKAYGKKNYGRGSGDKLAKHGKNVHGIANPSTLNALSPTGKKILEDNFKKDAHGKAILDMLYKKNFKIDFHGYSCLEALEELEDIIITLRHGMQGKFQLHITIITGKGNHSTNRKPVIKIAVLNYLRENDVKHKQQENNSGRIDIIIR